MKLSTRGRYGIHAMYDLALYAEGGPQSIKAIAEREGVPEAYLEQLICSLKKAGLVVSVRGAQGGYRIARSAEEISIGDILRALEGEVLQIECLADEEFCANACSCPSRRAAPMRLQEAPRATSMAETTVIASNSNSRLNRRKASCCWNLKAFTVMPGSS